MSHCWSLIKEGKKYVSPSFKTLIPLLNRFQPFSQGKENKIVETRQVLIYNLKEGRHQSVGICIQFPYCLLRYILLGVSLIEMIDKLLHIAA